MIINHLSLLSFKNFEQGELDFSASLNCFVGDNGSGKTNILDAIHYLSLTRSASGMSDTQSIRHGDSFFIIKGLYSDSDDRQEQITLTFRRAAGKKVLRSGKEYDRLTNHIGLIPVVMISPSDTYLISESGDERRKFINTHLSQVDVHYLSALSRYNALLAERNKLLKNPSGMGEVLDILSLQLSEVGQIIYKKRQKLIEEISPITSQYYKIISADCESVDMQYRSSLSDEPMEQLLRRSLERDYALGFTSVGVHRDDLDLSILGYPIRRYGSQGQQKSMLVALRLAQAKIIERSASGLKAILLLDDVFDKLDIQRVENLIKLVSSEDFGQIFITDSNKVRLEQIVERFSSEYKLFTVSNGEVTQ